MLSKRQEDVLTAWIDALFYYDPSLLLSSSSSSSALSNINNDNSNNHNNDHHDVISHDVTIKDGYQHSHNNQQQTIGLTLSSDPVYRQALRTTINEKIPSYVRVQLLLLLNILSNPMGTFLLCSMSYISSLSLSNLSLSSTSILQQRPISISLLLSFDMIPTEQRIILIQSLERNPNPILRQLFQGFKRFLCGIALTYYHTIHDNNNNNNNNPSSPSSIMILQDRNQISNNNPNLRTFRGNKNIKKDTIQQQKQQYYNPFWNDIGYPGPPTLKINNKRDNRHHRKTSTTIDSSRSLDIKKTIQDSIVQYLPNDIKSSSNITQTTITTYDDNNNNTKLVLQDEYDFIIIGSGSGGCVATYVINNELTNITILLIEKGSALINDNNITNLEYNSMDIMYSQHGTLTTIDSNIMLLAGNTLGGGTTINWCCCIPLPYYVLNEWNTILSTKSTHNNNNKNDLVFGHEYDNALNWILQRICQKQQGINDNDSKTIATNNNIQHNRMNQILIKGCQKLNYQYNSTQQNLKVNDMNEPIAGYICFGDKYNIKMGGIQAFLYPAIQKNNNNSNNNTIHILTQTSVQRVLTIHDRNMRSNKRAIGVECDISATKYNDNANDNDEVSNIHSYDDSVSDTKVVVASTSTNNNIIKKNIYARKGIILSAGALQTPCILQRSKFRNKHIGKHLYLHPVTAVLGFTTTATTSHNDNNSNNVKHDTTIEMRDVNTKHKNRISPPPPPFPPPPPPFPLHHQQSIKQDFNVVPTFQKKSDIKRSQRKKKSLDDDDDKNINCFWGAPMTSVCQEYQMGPLNDGYGCLIECPLLHPGLGAAFGPWRSPKQFRDNICRMNQVSPLICLQRDSGNGGTVRSNQYGELIIDYKLNEYDKQSVLNGLKGAIQILIASSNIKEIYTGNVHDPGLRLDNYQPIPSTESNLAANHVEDDDNQIQVEQQQQQIQEYLNSIERIGIKSYEASIASAHQMGTCRMSNSPKNGVVDLNGETWECDQLYIMDTSIFLTASGSNPMITVLTLSYMLSKRLALLMKYRQQQQKLQQYQEQGSDGDNIVINEDYLSLSTLDEINQGQIIEQERLDMRKKALSVQSFFTKLNSTTTIMTLYNIVLIGMQYSPFIVTFFCLLWFLWIK